MGRSGDSRATLVRRKEAPARATCEGARVGTLAGWGPWGRSSSPPFSRLYAEIPSATLDDGETVRSQFLSLRQMPKAAYSPGESAGN
jgi:hypothetical protein